MRDVFSIVLAGGRGERLWPLTAQRSKPAVPFAQVRIVDFVLSNLINSGINEIAVLTQTQSHSVDDHIMKAYPTYIGMRGSISIYHPKMVSRDDLYVGTANAVYQNLERINKKAEHVAVFGGDHIYMMDVSNMVRFHEKRNADITVAAVPFPISEAHKFGVIEVDEDWKIIGFEEKPAHPKSIPNEPDKALVSMGNYIFNKAKLFGLLEEDSRKKFVTKEELKEIIKSNKSGRDQYSTFDFGTDIIEGEVARKALNIFAYDFRKNKIPGIPEWKTHHYWRDVGDLYQYWLANMDICSIDPELNLYNADWPLWTLPNTLPPAKFIHDNKNENRVGYATNSIVCAGAIISGSHVERSVVGMNVKVNSWSYLEECVILGSKKYINTEIGRWCNLRRVIVDRDVVIPEGTIIGYEKNNDEKRGFKTIDVDDGKYLTVIPRGYKF
jgi:glucose-1-phosphate adenylyltransferase